jgi:hypothetical protein
MKTVIRNSYTPKIGDYCETIVVDKETENAYIFDCDGIFTQMPQPVDVEDILRRAAEYTDETVAPINEKLDTIEEGAQVNKIEHILENGTELTITNKTVNVTVPTKTSDLTNDGSDGTDTYVETAALDDYYTKTETDTQIGYETSAREIADQGLQEQIDAIVASSDVVDIVGTYAALQAYDTSKLHDNDIIKVLTDETRDDATTYYRWDSDTSTWGYIGAEGPFYTKAESDATFVPLTRTVNNKALSSDITLTAQDVGALPDSTVIPTVNDATLTIQKNGTSVQTFTANQSSDAVANITVPTDTSDLTNGAGFITSAALPTKTSDLTNDGSDGTSTYVEADDMPTKTSDFTNDGSDGTSTYVEADELATVATTGDYSDLLNTPTIPTVNDATLLIQKNGTDVASFTANSATGTTANIIVPTDTSDLTNGAGFITTSALSNYYTKSETYSQQEVNSLINTLTIPTKTSDLTNDGADGTSAYVEADDLATVATTGDYDDLLNKPTIPTIVDMTGATASTAGAHGYVPAPAAGDEGKFLQGDGTWATPADEIYTAGNGISIDANNEISVDTTVVATQTDLSGKQDTLTAGNAIDITNDTISVEVDSALDVSSTNPVQNSVVTAALNGKQEALTAGSNIQINNGVISATDTTYSDFVGTDGQTAGTHGLVPAPTTADAGEYLKADGTWDTPPGVTYTAGTGIDITGTTLSVDTSVIAELSDLPTKTSDLTNDGSDGTSTYVEADDLATVATSGSYNDLSNKPTIPAAQVNSDWNAASGVAQILNKPSLATVATTGDYDDLIDKPTIPTVNDATLTIQKNSTAIGTFTANASADKTINITVPTTAADVSALPASTKYGASISVSINTTDYKVTTTLKDQDGNTLGTAQVIDLPLESVVVNGSYDNANKKIILTLQNGNTVDIPVGDLVSGLQTEITSSNKLDADLVDDSTSANKFVTSSDITTWNGKQDALTAGSNIQISNNTISATDTTYTAGTNVQISAQNVISATDTTYSIMTGATSSVAGTSGLVPAPAAGDDTKVLKGDGTWGEKSDKFVIMKYGESNAWAKFIDAYNNNKIVYCRASSNANPATGAQTRLAFMAYVSAETNPTNVEFQYVRSVSSKTDSQQCDQVFVYKLTNASGGTWTVETRNMASKIVAGTNMTSSYSNGTITLNATQPTVPTKTSDLTNDGSDGTSTYVEVDELATVATSGDYNDLTNLPAIPNYAAGDHISISSNTISAVDYVHSENPVSVTTPGTTVSGSEITDGSITFDKTSAGEFLKLQLTTTDPGEGAALAANTLLGVYV